MVQKIKKIWNFLFVLGKAIWENKHEINCTKDWFKSYNIWPCSGPRTLGFYLLQNPGVNLKKIENLNQQFHFLKKQLWNRNQRSSLHKEYPLTRTQGYGQKLKPANTGTNPTLVKTWNRQFAKFSFQEIYCGHWIHKT
jgi:hypothetical protein